MSKNTPFDSLGTFPSNPQEGTVCYVQGKFQVYLHEKWNIMEKDTITITREQAKSIIFLIDIAESSIEAVEFGGDYGDLSEKYSKLEYELKEKLK